MSSPTAFFIFVISTYAIPIAAAYFATFATDSFVLVIRFTYTSSLGIVIPLRFVF